MTEEQIKHMASRFLGWTLPKTFKPDNGISYTPTQHSAALNTMPSGTNVFDAREAEAMVRHMVEGMPETVKFKDIPKPESTAGFPQEEAS